MRWEQSSDDGLIEQVAAGLLTVDEARKIRNLPPLTPAQKAEAALKKMPAPALVSDQNQEDE